MGAIPAMPRTSGDRFDLGYLALVVIMAAGGAHVMRPLQLAAVRAFDPRGRAERMVGPAHVAARFGCLFLWHCHGFVSRCLGSRRKRDFIYTKSPAGKRLAALNGQGKSNPRVSDPSIFPGWRTDLVWCRWPLPRPRRRFGCFRTPPRAHAEKVLAQAPYVRPPPRLCQSSRR